MENVILENLKRTVLEYEPKEAAKWAEKAIEEEVDPIKAMNVLTGAIREVGDGFGKKTLFLPELIGAAEAMKSATNILEEEIKKTGAKIDSRGTVVLGTIKGDIHNIGKSMLGTMLIANGFEVIDLGVDVGADKFVSAVKKYRADIIAMSALLTMYVAELEKVIQALKGEGIRNNILVMVGGGAISSEFAQKIGADGYAPTAPEGALLARKLIGK